MAGRNSEIIRCSGFVRSALALLVLASFAASAPAAESSYRVYVTNEGSGDLTVIDGVSHVALKTLTLGKRPRGLTASPDGRQLFVALTGSPVTPPGIDRKLLPNADKTADGISVVDIAPWHVDQVLKGVSDPQELAFSANGSRLYVVSEDLGQMVIMDPHTTQVVANLTVGGEAEGIAVSPAGDRICVTSEDDNDVSLIDAQRNVVLKTIKVGQRPRDAAFSPDGSLLYVPGEYDRSLSVIDVKSMAVIRTVQVPDEHSLPKGVAVSHDGRRIYVSTGRGGHVVAYDAKTFAVIANVAVGSRPWGIALSPDSRYLYTANGPSNDVSVIDTESMTVIATVKVGSRPWGVAIIGDPSH